FSDPALEAGSGRPRAPAERPAHMVPPPPAPAPVARDARSLPHLGVGDPAAADAGGDGHALLRAIPDPVPHRPGAGAGPARRPAGRMARARLLSAGACPARGGAGGGAGA